jgi:hypothetical protein
MQHRKETFERLMPSAYIERVKKELPDYEGKSEYLRDLRNLKWLMIASRMVGTGYGGAILLRGLGDSYPEAHEAFEKELGL